MRLFFLTAVVALGVPNGSVVYAQAPGGVTANHASMPMQPPSAARAALLTDPLGSRAASGTSTVTGTMVRMVWYGDQPGAVRSWSVRRGSCTRDEGLVGEASAYAPITVDASGSASGSANIGAPLAADSQFHLRVQSSADSPATGAVATTLACGTLRNAAAPVRAAAKELTTSPNGSKPAAADHSAMDHSMMDHSGMNMSGTGASGGAAGASSSSTNVSRMDDSTMMAIHMRMMADPVIRERVMTDPVLKRMMAQMPGMSSMNTDMPRMTSEPAAGAGATGSTTAASAAAKPATRATRMPATKPAAKPAAKPATKPAPAAMPGMDHSKMPGMDPSTMPVAPKPPGTRKPPA